MAIIDVDRHILLEIIDLDRKIRVSEEILNKHWKIISDSRAKQEALLTHLVSCVKEADTHKGLETNIKENLENG